MAKLRLGVLISGRGSNLQALIDACAKADFPAEIAHVLSNRPQAEGLKRAERSNIAASVISHEIFSDRMSFERAISAQLEQSKVDLVCLAGFMRLLSPWFVQRWHNRLINIHPSLLPSFKGLNTHARALAAGVRFTGCTVHFVRAEMDEGPILLQAAVPILPEDDADKLALRVLEAEHLCYPAAIRLLAEGRVALEGDIARIAPNAIAASPTISFNPPFNPLES